jgi:hypothetical protein
MPRRLLANLVCAIVAAIGSAAAGDPASPRAPEVRGSSTIVSGYSSAGSGEAFARIGNHGAKAEPALMCGNPTSVKRRCGIYVYPRCMAQKHGKVFCDAQRLACGACGATWIDCVGKAKSKGACEPCHDEYWACMTQIGAPPARE